MTGWSASQREAFAAAIAAERRRTTERIAGLTHDFAVIVEAVDLSPPDDEHDPEGATVGFERAQLGALLTSSRSHLVQLDAAQQRLDDGAYGTCVTCEKPIAVERLLTRPTATTCVACAGLAGAKSRP